MLTVKLSQFTPRHQWPLPHGAGTFIRELHAMRIDMQKANTLFHYKFVIPLLFDVNNFSFNFWILYRLRFPSIKNVNFLICECYNFGFHFNNNFISYFVIIYKQKAEIQRNREFYKNADVRPPFTYASLIRQVSFTLFISFVHHKFNAFSNKFFMNLPKLMNKILSKNSYFFKKWIKNLHETSTVYSVFNCFTDKKDWNVWIKIKKSE